MYKQTVRDIIALCGWKGSIPIGRKLSSAGRHLLRYLPSFIPWLLNREITFLLLIHSQMFLSMSPSAKVLHHFLMHDNPEGPGSYSIHRECSKTATASCNLSWGRAWKKTVIKKSHVANGQKQHLQNAIVGSKVKQHPETGTGKW